MNRYEQSVSWKDRMKDVKRWASVERIARNTTITLIVISAAFVVGQFTAASAITTEFVESNLDAWAAGDPHKAQAVEDFRQCKVHGPAVTLAGCVEQAAPGETGKALSDQVHQLQATVSRGMPAPLNWFFN
ncbi:hypothetical protein [Ralstonia pickettii]|uniref:Transmembrane protein n=1 Tax=Ralstonia pickettii TaxID=329 RepID=A0AAW4Q9Y9_RALPI|nr:hypothetical protein [Ralstonia pickettii]MBA9846743.1 hypothetical protein [Ralstonia pickettii]MBA9852105.1 hypothetical protein [Ralstonia pickettii]MBA9919880.1 hypothetical protein [Ralstonia pickettii]MBA9958982.1 hypothetical protein [Ralstonia pickettii]MBA9964639.1 hypothetical protein [Ralstonia pickettii]